MTWSHTPLHAGRLTPTLIFISNWSEFHASFDIVDKGIINAAPHVSTMRYMLTIKQFTRQNLSDFWECATQLSWV